mgnify:CR=1 FL=1
MDGYLPPRFPDSTSTLNRGLLSCASISLIASSGYAFVVNPSVLNPKDLNDFVAIIKANPGKYTYGTNGIGGTYHLEMELFKQQFGINLEQVPYKTSIEAINALVAGEIPLVYAPVGAVMPLVRAGKMRLLVVLDNKRYPDLPNVPTVDESGVKGYNVILWHGLIGPKGLPRPIIDRINGDLNKALQSKEMQDRLAGDGVSAAGGTPEQFAAQIRDDLARWEKVVKTGGIKVE